MTAKLPARHEHLERLLDDLWEALAEADAGSRAGLSREIRLTLAELAVVAPVEGKSKADELASRREARRVATADRPLAAKRGRPRRSG